MKKAYIFLIALTVFSLLFFLRQSPTEVSAQTVNIFSDGFDGDWYSNSCTAGDGRSPSGWGSWQISNSRCAMREPVIQDGGLSVKMSSSPSEAGSPWSPLAGIYRGAAIAPGANYTLTGKSYRFYDRSADYVGFQFCSASSCGAIDWKPLYGEHGTGSWDNFSKSATAPSDAQNLNVFLAQGYNQYTGGDSPNDVYFDNVTLSAQAVNNASCTSLAAPDTVTVGQSFSASVQMRNTGSTSWNNAGNYRLGSQNSPDTLWGPNRAAIVPDGSAIAPGSTGVFNFNVSAPSTAGSHLFTWQMVQDGVQWFGGTCSKTIVVVNAPTPTPPPTPTPTTAPVTLKNLYIDANYADDPAGVHTSSYGVSGQRSNENQKGSNYYNSLDIRQEIENLGNAKLIGFGFLKGGGTGIASNASLNTLMSVAREQNGFIVLYSPCAGASVSGCSGGGTQFTANTFKVYFKDSYGQYNWQGPYGQQDSFSLLSQGLKVNFLSFSNSSPYVPFYVTLYPALGSRTYWTYQYLMDINNIETGRMVDPVRLYP